MKISITFKNIPSSEALKSHIHEKFDRFEKMLEYPADAHFVLTEEKLVSIAEIKLTCDKLKIIAKDKADNNMYAAIDALSEKVKSQIRKNKDKQRRHLAGDKRSIKQEVSETLMED